MSAIELLATVINYTVRFMSIWVHKSVTKPPPIGVEVYGGLYITIQSTWCAHLIMEINGYLGAIADDKQAEQMRKNSYLSKNWYSSASARSRPTVLFPDPIIPMRKMQVPSISCFNSCAFLCIFQKQSE
jgi:hypothetical protein